MSMQTNPRISRYLALTSFTLNISRSEKAKDRESESSIRADLNQKMIGTG